MLDGWVFGGRNFSKTNSQAINKALDKLRKNTLALEDILDSEELLRDLKFYNSHISYYFDQEENIKKLFDYIIKFPEQNDPKKDFKFPFTACEILSSENNIIYDYVFSQAEIEEDCNQEENESCDVKEEEEEIEAEVDEDENKIDSGIDFIEEKQEEEEIKTSESINNENEILIKKEKTKIKVNKKNNSLLEYFFSFLTSTSYSPENSSRLNCVLCGYFDKVFEFYISKQQKYLMNYLFIKNTNYLECLARNIYNKSLVNCIYYLLISYSNIPRILQLKIEFIKLILKNFNSEDDEIVSNITDLFIDILSIRKTYVLFMSNKDFVSLVFEFVLQNINNSSFKHLIRILIKINENILQDYDNYKYPNKVKEESDWDYTQPYEQVIVNLISGVASEANEFLKENSTKEDLLFHLETVFPTLITSTECILLNFNENEGNSTKEIETTFGTKMKALGEKKLLEMEYIKTIFQILNVLYSDELFANKFNSDLIINKVIDSGFFIKSIVTWAKLPA